MSYPDPKTVLHPMGDISNLKVIRDGGENNWSLASMKWVGSDVIGMRWNGGMNNGSPSIGTPQSRGTPLWFVLPDEVKDSIIEVAKKLNEEDKNKKKG